MVMRGLSQTVIEIGKQGPFADQVDPWVEDGHYFQSLHSEMISVIFGLTQDTLLQKGYLIGRETGIQIVEGRAPDLFIQPITQHPYLLSGAQYGLAAVEALSEPGIEVEEFPGLEALFIRTQSGELVTVIELISPRNKRDNIEIEHYRERRSRLFLEQAVNVVEIDLTRSVKRLIHTEHALQFAYHAAVFLPREPLRFVGMRFEDPLTRIAVPLRDEVIAIDLQQVYITAYRQTLSALHIWRNQHYTEKRLPFPTLLTEEQRGAALDAVRVWQEQLHAAQTGE